MPAPQSPLGIVPVFPALGGSPVRTYGEKTWLSSAHIAFIILNTINLQTILYNAGGDVVGTLGAFTKLRILSGILSILLALETGYIIWGHHRINRFKTMDEDGYLAFDSATGQLCRTFRRGPRVQENQPAQTKPSPSSLDSKKSSSKVDPILSAIRGGLTETEQWFKTKNMQMQKLRLNSSAAFRLAQTSIRSS